MKVDDKRYIGVTFEGSKYPDGKYQKVNVVVNHYILNEYIPAIKKLNLTKGMELLLTAMAIHEGFYPKSRSYENNNPGNIGNTDSGANKKFGTLEDGIKRQIQFINDIITGKEKAFPMNKPKVIEPFYSKEIAKNPQYGLPANLPGYRFLFTGQLDQYVKIYATGPRASDNYVNSITSYFEQNGIHITPESKIQDIIKLT